MTRVSAIPLSKGKLNQLLNSLWNDIAYLDDSRSVYTFFKPFFTPTEPVIFAKRLAILKLLRSGSNYDEIRNELKVTPTTISKMSNLLYQADQKLLNILDELINAEKERDKKYFNKGRSHPNTRFWPTYTGNK